MKWLAGVGIPQECHGAGGFLAVLPAPSSPRESRPKQRDSRCLGSWGAAHSQGCLPPEDATRTHKAQGSCNHTPSEAEGFTSSLLPFSRSPSTGRRDRRREESEDSLILTRGSWLRAGSAGRGAGCGHHIRFKVHISAPALVSCLSPRKGARLDRNCLIFNTRKQLKSSGTSPKFY